MGLTSYYGEKALPLPSLSTPPTILMGIRYHPMVLATKQASAAQYPQQHLSASAKDK